MMQFHPLAEFASHDIGRKPHVNTEESEKLLSAGENMQYIEYFHRGMYLTTTHKFHNCETNLIDQDETFKNIIKEFFGVQIPLII